MTFYIEKREIKMKFRLRHLLQIGVVAGIIYLILHFYINYKLSNDDIDDINIDDEYETSSVSFACNGFPRPHGFVIEKLPQKLKEGVFFLPTKLDFMKPSSSVPVTYAVDIRFPPLTSNGEAEHYMRLVRKLSNLFTKANITFFLAGGSLLGSYMTHGMLPWDDDIDIIVKWSHMPKVKTIFKESKSMWKIYNVTGYGDDIDLYSKKLITKSDFRGETIPSKNEHLRHHRFKFFAIDSLRAGNKTWNWPNLDVVYYKENRTHIWSFGSNQTADIIPKETVFPLHLRPFGPLWLPAPRDTHEYLVTKYGSEFRCLISGRNHRLERLRDSVEVPCCSLLWTYPIVLREKALGGVIETLLLGNETLHSIFVKEKPKALHIPYQF